MDRPPNPQGLLFPLCLRGFFSFFSKLTITVGCRLASSVRPTTSKTVPKLTTPTTSTTLIIRANISRRGRNGFTADSVRRGLNTSIRFEVVMYRLRCTGLINDCVRYMGNACHSCLKRRELSLLAKKGLLITGHLIMRI